MVVEGLQSQKIHFNDDDVNGFVESFVKHDLLKDDETLKEAANMFGIVQSAVAECGPKTSSCDTETTPQSPKVAVKKSSHDTRHGPIPRVPFGDGIPGDGYLIEDSETGESFILSSVVPEKMNYYNATGENDHGKQDKDYCQKISPIHQNYRLPTQKELVILAQRMKRVRDDEKYDSGSILGIRSEKLWYAESSGDDYHAMVFVGFAGRADFIIAKLALESVRCVRDAEPQRPKQSHATRQ